MTKVKRAAPQLRGLDGTDDRFYWRRGLFKVSEDLLYPLIQSLMILCPTPCEQDDDQRDDQQAAHDDDDEDGDGQAGAGGHAGGGGGTGG